MTARYVLITPTRDDARHARTTLDSVLAQSVRPARWIIVDDGSTDGASEILDHYARRHHFIHVIHRDNRGQRSVGPGVVEAFYVGLAVVDLSRFDFLCKLDLDLRLPPRYFQRLIEIMRDNPRLGTVSGKPYFPADNAELVSEGCGNEMSVGMTKFYRIQCFNQIGGFVREVMWDGIDCHRCRMLGWSAASFDEPDLRFVHLRPMGSSDRSIFTGRLRHGYGQYFMGTSLAYMTASAACRMTCRPLVLGGLAMWLGYVESLLSGRRRYRDPAFRRFLRRYQRRCLLLGKNRATEQIDREQSCRWTPPRRDIITRPASNPANNLANNLANNRPVPSGAARDAGAKGSTS